MNDKFYWDKKGGYNIVNRNDEIQSVKELGERIGYGNMMDIASALWANVLGDKYGFSTEATGAFVPAMFFQLKSQDKKKAVARLELMREQVKND